MRLVACLIALVPMVTAATLERVGPYLITNEVYVNGAGPLRFLVDTGAQSCALTEEAARKAGVQATGRVNQTTVAGERLTAAGRARITVDHVTTEDAEVLIGGVDGIRAIGTKVDGVLGQSFLLGLDYLLDVKRGALMLTVPPPDGVPLRLEMVDGRPAVRVDVSGRTRMLTLDSGAPALVLFGEPMAGVFFRGVSTNAGETRGSIRTELIRVGRRARRVPAVVLSGAVRTTDGLLPLSAFDSVYVGSSERVVIFDGR